MPVTDTTVTVKFDLDETELKKIQTLKLELELYQWRLKIFDSLIDETGKRSPKFSQPIAIVICQTYECLYRDQIDKFKEIR